MGTPITTDNIRSMNTGLMDSKYGPAIAQIVLASDVREFSDLNIDRYIINECPNSLFFDRNLCTRDRMKKWATGIIGRYNADQSTDRLPYLENPKSVSQVLADVKSWGSALVKSSLLPAYPEGNRENTIRPLDTTNIHPSFCKRLKKYSMPCDNDGVFERKRRDLQQEHLKKMLLGAVEIVSSYVTVVLNASGHDGDNIYAQDIPLVSEHLIKMYNGDNADNRLRTEEIYFYTMHVSHLLEIARELGFEKKGIGINEYKQQLESSQKFEIWFKVLISFSLAMSNLYFENDRTTALEQLYSLEDMGLRTSSNLSDVCALKGSLEHPAIQNTLPSTINRVLIIGPGREFVNSDQLFNSGIQMIEPFVVADSLLKMKKSKIDDLQIDLLDINPYVISLVDNIKVAGHYTLNLNPIKGMVLSEMADECYADVGGRIAENNELLSTQSGFKKIHVKQSIVDVMTGYLGDITVDRLAVEEKYDLIISYNMVIYFNELERTLFASNVASLLKTGGVLLLNNELMEDPKKYRGGTDTLVSLLGDNAPLTRRVNYFRMNFKKGPTKLIDMENSAIVDTIKNSKIPAIGGSPMILYEKTD